jgi:serine/threonine protein kinase
MPRLPQPGNVINGYSILNHINAGGMANAYEAKAPDGSIVFFKQYKSPSVGLPWFNGFVEYNKELNRRIAEPDLQRFCVRHITSFVWKFGVDTFYQVYEWAKNDDLEKILDRAKTSSGAITWEQRLIMARVIMAAIDKLHSKRIVHGDLKPSNIQMLHDPTVRVGYKPKLIDMDRSVLADKRAPWDGIESYTGTPRYFSPEHFCKKVPATASDVFTCGIILYQLLGQGHPFPTKAEDPDAAYSDLVRKDSPPPPRLQGRLPGDDTANKHLIDTLQRCLRMDAKLRPTALEVNRALNGKIEPVETLPTPPASPPVPSHYSSSLVGTPSDKRGSSSLTGIALPTGSPSRTETVAAGSLVLESKGSLRAPLRVNVRTEIGRHLLRQLDEGGLRADDVQFTVEPRAGGWWIIPNPSSIPWTTVNGENLETEQRLKDGDVLCLKGRKSGKVLSPILVKLS